LAYIELVNKDITVEIAQQQLRDTFRSSQVDNIRIETIQRVIADHYGISSSDLRGKKKTKSIVMPRHIALYIAGELTQASTPDLGREFGGRDHSTVMYSQDKIATALKTDSKLDAEIQLLIRQIKDYKN
jgi:chromosomal replication initiator protein